MKKRATPLSRLTPRESIERKMLNLKFEIFRLKKKKIFFFSTENVSRGETSRGHLFGRLFPKNEKKNAKMPRGRFV